MATLARCCGAVFLCLGLIFGLHLFPIDGQAAVPAPDPSLQRQGPSKQLHLVQGKGSVESKNASETRSRPNDPAPRQSPSAGREGAQSLEQDAQSTYKTPYEVWLTLLTVLLGVGTLGLFSLTNRGDARDPNFPRHFIIISVIFAALFLIVAGYTEKQTAPVFGLLGTIVGYLFGVTSQRSTGDGTRRDGGQPGSDASLQKASDNPKKPGDTQ